MLEQQTDLLVTALFGTVLKFGLPALIICALLSFISARLTRRKKQKRTRNKATPLPTLLPLQTLPVTARRPLSAREEQMYIALNAALPECTVLAQVSFQALIDTTRREDRNRFDRKYADFVICSKHLTPVAIIELDDRSHTNKTEQDADRDTMLKNAGYTTLRYRAIPTTEQIRLDIETILSRLIEN
jgi:very-short-patch-repair endonuclease